MAIAQDAQTTLTLSRDRIFDLALIDMKLPDMPGSDLINRWTELSAGTEHILIRKKEIFQTYAFSSKSDKFSEVSSQSWLPPSS